MEHTSLRRMVWNAFFVWPWTAFWLLTMAAIITWQAGQYLTYDDRQPVQFDRVEIMNSPVRPGDTLIGRVFRDKVRDDCPVTAERMAISQDGEIIPLETVTWPGGPAGTPFFDVRYALPDDMPEGLYTLRVNVTYHCPRGLEFSLVQPLSQFRVLRNPEALTAPALGLLPPGLLAPMREASAD